MTSAGRLPERKSIRLRGFDYGSFGPYFVTICTHQRQCFLATVSLGTVYLTPRGETVRSAWFGLSQRFPALVLDEFVIMPNHIHGIVGILPVGAGLAPPARGIGKSPSLGSIVDAFKSISTIEVNRKLGTKGSILWQKNYYEHIIRNGAALADVQRYIAENPLAWNVDPENPDKVAEGGASPTHTGENTDRKPGPCYEEDRRSSSRE